MFILSEPCMRRTVKLTVMDKSAGSFKCASLYGYSYGMLSFFH